MDNLLSWTHPGFSLFAGEIIAAEDRRARGPLYRSADACDRQSSAAPGRSSRDPDASGATDRRHGRLLGVPDGQDTPAHYPKAPPGPDVADRSPRLQDFACSRDALGIKTPIRYRLIRSIEVKLPLAADPVCRI